MASIEEIDDNFSDPDDMVLDDVAAPVEARATGLRPPLMAGGPGLAGQAGYKQVEQHVYKEWTTLYPIYIDAKRAQQVGQRRVNRSTAVEWPIAEFMAQACGILNVEAVFEPMKSHPKDWANPGRVKVHLLESEGQPLNKLIPNKRILLRKICEVLRQHQPISAKAKAKSSSSASGSNPAATSATQSNKKKTKQQKKQRKQQAGTVPPIAQRLPAHSPAVSHGVLASALKGGGLGGMLGNMLGGGAAGAPGSSGADADQDEAAAAAAAKKKEVKAPPKMKKIHPKKRR